MHKPGKTGTDKGLGSVITPELFVYLPRKRMSDRDSETLNGQ